MTRSETTEVEVRTFLDTHYGDGVGNVALLGAGDWSKAFAFDHAGRPLVARFGKFREDFEMDRLAMEFQRPGLPVPKILEIGSAFDGAFAISERHEGHFLETVESTTNEKSFATILHLLDALREVPVDQASSASWYGSSRQISWREWLTMSVEDDHNERVGGWRVELAKAPEAEAMFTLASREMVALAADLPSHLHLVHRDLLNRNVLVNERSEVTAVYDWGCSVYGDYLYDVAWFTFWAPWIEGISEIRIADRVRSHHQKTGVDVTNFNERLKCYELHIGVQHLAYNTVTNAPTERTRVGARLQNILSGEQ